MIRAHPQRATWQCTLLVQSGGVVITIHQPVQTGLMAILTLFLERGEAQALTHSQPPSPHHSAHQLSEVIASQAAQGPFLTFVNNNFNFSPLPTNRCDAIVKEANFLCCGWKTHQVKCFVVFFPPIVSACVSLCLNAANKVLGTSHNKGASAA